MTAAGLETEEKAEPWLVGRSVLLDGQVVRQKVGRFEEDLTVLRSNAEVGRQNGSLRADREIVRRAGLFGQGEPTAGSCPKHGCACSSGRTRCPYEDLLLTVDEQASTGLH